MKKKAAIFLLLCSCSGKPTRVLLEGNKSPYIKFSKDRIDTNISVVEFYNTEQNLIYIEETAGGKVIQTYDFLSNCDSISFAKEGKFLYKRFCMSCHDVNSIKRDISPENYKEKHGYSLDSLKINENQLIKIIYFAFHSAQP